MIERIAQIVADSMEVKRRYFEEHAGQVLSAAALISECFAAGGKLLLCGNGGSAADAQHIAGEFINRFMPMERRGLPAIALSTDGGVLTCIANDTGFDRVFARQIEALGVRGDVCMVISTSGTSANVVAAAEQARSQGLKTIGLLGRDGGRVAELCDLSMIVPSRDTQRIQETHNLIGHVICELVETALFAKEEDGKERR
ncbi:MAG TPA: D-sedoheptulose 7-phosphate isomerase [Pyrinomonadaceae bacterium]|nr:D-sedoheptulose 7-phosphate isomerase [Pyrinomonadaceae bacterium]